MVEILEYVARDKPQAAIKLVSRIEAKCLLISSSPHLGQLQPHLGKGVRTSAVGRYVIFHRNANNRVEILRVIPGDRNIIDL